MVVTKRTKENEMKQLYLIYDAIGQIGSQIASTKERAIQLFSKKHDLTLAVKPIKAYSMANEKLPE